MVRVSTGMVECSSCFVESTKTCKINCTRKTRKQDVRDRSDPVDRHRCRCRRHRRRHPVMTVVTIDSNLLPIENFAKFGGRTFFIFRFRFNRSFDRA